MAARCVGVLSKIATLETMNQFLERVLPWMAAIEDSTKQEGAIEAMACILYQYTVGYLQWCAAWTFNISCL